MFNINNYKLNKSGHLIPLLLITLITFAAFVITFKGGFVYDDFPVFVNNKEVKYWHFFDLWSFFGRGTRTLSLMVDYHIFGNSPAGYHFQNILWHLFSSQLLYVMFFMLSKDRFVSLIGAILFALHPIHVESVASIANRKDPLCMFFSLAAIIFYINFIKQEGRQRRVYLLLTLMSCFLAINSKEVAFVLPIIFAIYEYLFVGKGERFLLKKPVFFLSTVFLGSLSFLFYVVKNFGSSKGGYSFEGGLSPLSAFLTFGEALIAYIKLLFFPLNLSPDHVMNLSTSFTDLAALLSLFIVSALIALSFFLVRRVPLVSFGIFWLLVNYLPVSTFIPRTYLLADRYMYIPSAGFCLLGAILFKKCYVTVNRCNDEGARKKTLLLYTALLLILTFYVIKVISYSYVWMDEKRLWAYAIKVSPKSYTAYYNYGVFNGKEGGGDSLKYLSQAIERQPNKIHAYLARGNVYRKSGMLDLAIKDYRKAASLRSDNVIAQNGLGLSYMDKGDFGRAMASFKKAIELDKDNPQAYYNMATLYYSTGNNDVAMEYLGKAINANPDYAEAYNNRGNINFMKGRLQAALKDYSKAVELNPKDAMALYNMGLVYSKLDNTLESNKYYEKAASLGLKEAASMIGGVK